MEAESITLRAEPRAWRAYFAVFLATSSAFRLAWSCEDIVSFFCMFAAAILSPPTDSFGVVPSTQYGAAGCLCQQLRPLPPIRLVLYALYGPTAPTDLPRTFLLDDLFDLG